MGKPVKGGHPPRQDKIRNGKSEHWRSPHLLEQTAFAIRMPGQTKTIGCQN